MLLVDLPLALSAGTTAPGVVHALGRADVALDGTRFGAGIFRKRSRPDLGGSSMGEGGQAQGSPSRD